MTLDDATGRCCIHINTSSFLEGLFFVSDITSVLAIRKLEASLEIDLELAVWRHPLWLDRRQINPNDTCIRVFVSEVYSPDASAGADVEDTLIILLGTPHQLPIVGYQALLVKHVEAVLLYVVVGQRVLAGVVVSATIFFDDRYLRSWAYRLCLLHVLH